MQDVKYIKAPGKFKREYSLSEPAPLFRKTFTLDEGFISAKIGVIGLGYGYFYINGNKITEDLFISPVSEYNKTVWYTEYDVTSLLKSGENVISAMLGNGFFNETFNTCWGTNTAEWRDKPKMAVKLSVEYNDKNFLLETDDTWKVTEKSPVTFNQLRSGEYYDARLYQKGWNDLGFDDSSWDNAVIDENEPKGIKRLCTSEPIRKFERYAPVSIKEVSNGKYLFEFPCTISGFIELNTKELKRGQKIKIRYAEAINDDLSLDFKGSDDKHFYPESRYEWDEFTADGEEFLWSPKFTYHGIRYMEIEGFDKMPEIDTVSAVWVHQAIDRRTKFFCSNEDINTIFSMGINATWSNMFYMPTDCPSREKFGWANDACVSCEQFLTNFKSYKFLKKWYQDVLDSMKEDGSVSCVIPTGGWGYEWGAGPISTGVLYEIPYRIYQYMGDDSLLKNSLSYFIRHLDYIISNVNSEGFIDYGLCDWAGPWESCEMSPVPREVTNTLLYIKFLRITELSAELNGDLDSLDDLKKEESRITKKFKDKYFNNGKMLYPYQASLSMAIELDIYTDYEITKQELIESVERENYHINCGMLGIRYLYNALTKIGRRDLAYKIITQEGFPGYIEWIRRHNPTTMLETWSGENSHNHHMYSDVLVWIIKNIGGINITDTKFSACEINPYFAEDIDWCELEMDTESGVIKTNWKKTLSGIDLEIEVPEKSKVFYENELLKHGKIKFLIKRREEK